MIKFFRRIRQKLLSENKFSKYLIYAVGEIILVVIGILIALKINNWNQNQQKEKQEIVYYCKIKEDLLTDKSNIVNGLQSLDKRNSSGKKLLENLYEHIDDKSIIMEGFLPAVRSYNFFPSKSAIQDITSSGKLENLTNSKLKSSILQHYTDLDYLMSVIENNRINLIKFNYEYEDMMDFGIHQIPIYKDIFGEELLSKMPNVNWQKDKNNIIFKQFQEHIGLSIVSKTREKDLLNQILSSTENLISKLDQYCKNLE